MSAPPLSNTFEGGTDGVEITTANSGGTSGNAFDTTTSGAEGSPFFSNVQARDTLSMRFNYTVAPGGTLFAGWSGLGSLTGNVYTRFYIYMAALPAGNNGYFQSVRTNADSTSAILRVLTDGTIQGRDATNSQISAGSVACATGQWIRIETRTLSSTTVGEFEWRLYNTADSITISDTANATGAALGANTDRCNFGLNVTAPAAPYTIFYDDIAVSTVNWLGPTQNVQLADNPPIGLLGRGAGW